MRWLRCPLLFVIAKGSTVVPREVFLWVLLLQGACFAYYARLAFFGQEIELKGRPVQRRRECAITTKI